MVRSGVQSSGSTEVKPSRTDQWVDLKNSALKKASFPSASSGLNKDKKTKNWSRFINADPVVIQVSKLHRYFIYRLDVLTN